MQLVRRIRQTPVEQRVADQQMREIVRAGRRGDGALGKQHQPEHDRQQGQQQHREPRAPRKTLQPGDGTRVEDDEQNEKRGESQLDEIVGAETDGIVKRQEGVKEPEPKHQPALQSYNVGMRFATFLACLAFASAGFGDTLTLRDGQVVNGTYSGGTARTVKMEVGDTIKTYDVYRRRHATIYARLDGVGCVAIRHTPKDS